MTIDISLDNNLSSLSLYTRLVAFPDLSNVSMVEIVVVNDNLISHVSRSRLAALPHIQKIYISGNKIPIIPYVRLDTL